jgi:hypothetical protein
MLGRGFPSKGCSELFEGCVGLRDESIRAGHSKIQRVRTQFFTPATLSVLSLLQFCNTPARDTGVTRYDSDLVIRGLGQ